MHTLALDQHLPFTTFNDTEIPSLGFVQFGAIDRAMQAFAMDRGVRVRLTGYAADALFQKGSPPMYLSEWIREGRIRDWLREYRAYVANGSFSAWHLLRYCTLGTLDMHCGSLRTPPPEWLRPSFRGKLREAAARSRDARHSVFSGCARERVFRSTLCFIPPHSRMLPDERMPFVARPLVEFVLAIDWQYLVRPGVDRLLMRRALTGILPDAVRTRTSKGTHGAPLLQGLQVAWPQVATLLSGERLGALGVVEPKLFRAALTSARAGFAGLNRQYLNTALYLEAWLATKPQAAC